MAIKSLESYHAKQHMHPKSIPSKPKDWYAMFGIPLHVNNIMKRKTNDILIFMTEILLSKKVFLFSGQLLLYHASVYIS
jgi:hypothetical protein